MHPTFKTITIPHSGINALAWAQDRLIDTTTNQTFHLDGTLADRHFLIGGKFNRGLSVQARSGHYTIACKNRGTKAVILKNGKVHRQLNRDYYCAEAYDYPIAMTSLSDGRVVIAHCPESYDTLALEDADTGEILAIHKSHGMEFHSRLQFSSDNRRLLSAGWFWHPLGGACVYDLDFTAASNSIFANEAAFSYGSEIANASFSGTDRIVVATSDQIINDEIPANGLGPLKLGVWSIPLNRWLHVSDLKEPIGTMMPWQDYVVSFYGNPKLIEIATGSVVHRWDHIHSGTQKDCIDIGDPEPPPIAFDPKHGRFAVSTPDLVTIVCLKDAAS